VENLLVQRKKSWEKSKHIHHKKINFCGISSLCPQLQAHTSSGVNTGNYFSKYL